MSLIYSFNEDGAFIAADTKSRRSVYAYPNSIHASEAKQEPSKTAAEMIEQENSYGSWRDKEEFRQRDEARIGNIR